MAVTVAWLNAKDGNPVYDAHRFRLATLSLMAGAGDEPGRTRSGIRYTGGADLHVTTDGTAVTVAPGQVLVDGAAAFQGAYEVTVDQPEKRQIPPRHAVMHRTDAIVVLVLDDDIDATGKREARIDYLPGEAGPDPRPPDPPATSLLLALVDVPPERTPDPPVVRDARVWLSAAGGVIRSTYAAHPSDVPAGSLTYEADTGRLLLLHEGRWLALFNPRGATWTDLELREPFKPHPSTAVIPAYRRESGWVNLRGRITKRDGKPFAGLAERILQLPKDIRPGATYAFPIAVEYSDANTTGRVEVRAEDGWLWAWVPRSHPAEWIDLAGVRFTAVGQ